MRARLVASLNRLNKSRRTATSPGERLGSARHSAVSDSWLRVRSWSVKPAEIGVARMEGLALGVRGGDEPVRDRAGRRTAARAAPKDCGACPGSGSVRASARKLRLDEPSSDAGNLRPPWRSLAADRCPDPPRVEPVAAVVERIGMGKGERVEAVELVAAGERERGRAELDIGARLPGRRAAGRRGCDSRPCRPGR